MSDFRGIGRNEIGMNPRRERDRVRRQSLQPPSNTVQTVYIYPVDENGTDVETVSEPFHIRRGARMHEFRVDAYGPLFRAPVDQLIAGITQEQIHYLTPTQYWELRRHLMTEESRQRISFRDGRITNGQGQWMELRDGSVSMNFEGEGINPETLQMLTGGEVLETEEDLTVVEYGPDKGTTELWKGLGKKRRIVAMTVDGIYYNKHADKGQPGYSSAPSAQPLFQIKKSADGEGFIYDEFGYVDGDNVQWDSPFRWVSEGKSMKPMFELTDKDMG